MKTLHCSQCRGKLTTSIGPLRPMGAIAAQMLEQGVILGCSKYTLYSTGASDIECPKCGRKTLTTSLEAPRRGQPNAQKRSGKIFCASCGWEQKIGSRPLTKE